MAGVRRQQHHARFIENHVRTRAARRFNLTQTAKSENGSGNHELKCARKACSFRRRV
jgi:hypothetical protein